MLQEQIRMLGANDDWQGVVVAGHELEALDPAGADVDGLLSRARQELTDRTKPNTPQPSATRA